jgi:DNA modification methylase
MLNTLLQNVLFVKANIPKDIAEFFEEASCGKCYVCKMVDVFREVRRVLRKDGTVWCNLGDSYFGSGQGFGDIKTTNKNHNGSRERRKPEWSDCGLKPKDLCGVPWRVAFALQTDGWYLRQDIIWAKPNPMPESVTDRCTKSHEYIFLLTKSAKYYYDAKTIAEPVAESSIERLNQDIENQTGSSRVQGKINGSMKAVAPASWNGSKFEDGKNAITHPNVGKNRKHNGTDHGSNGIGFQTHNGCSLNRPDGLRNKRSVWTVTTQPFKEAHFATFPPNLIRPCVLAGCPQGGTILDPFGGAGTTALVSEEEGRNSILIELNPAYIEIAKKRTRQQGLFCK